MLQDEMLGNFVLIGTFIGPSKPFKLPRKNRAVTAIQKLVLRPNSVLKIILKSSIYRSQCWNGKTYRLCLVKQLMCKVFFIVKIA
jgi:hypothetical protein